MYSKLIFAIASLCVVNASVVTINVLDDVENEAVSLLTLRDCNYQACEQLCRRLGFTGGVCDNGRCKCDINKKDAASEAPASFMDSAEPELVRSCKNRACHQRCRKFGYTGGICVNGRCKCDLYRNDAVPEPHSSFMDSAEPETLRSCNNRVCHQRCRRTGFSGGICVDGVCKCDINRISDVSEPPVSFMDSAEYQPLESCNNQECDQRCRRLAFTGGVCVNGWCKCDINRNGDVSEPSASVLDSAESQPLESCNNQECDQRCRRLAFTGGVCVNGWCKCDINRNGDVSEPPVSFMDSAESQPLENCNNQECDQRCRRLAFTGGVCVNGWCKCDINRNGDVSEPPVSFMDSAESQPLENCNNQECDQWCRRLTFTGGVCVNGRCRCDRNKNEVPEVAEPLSEQMNALPRDCNYRECDQRCRRLGFTGGACANGRCKCDINRNGDVSEPPASYLDSTESPLGGCNNQECDQRCRRLAFTGGVCVNGRCKCDINRKEPVLVNDVTNGKDEEKSEEVSTDKDELPNSLRSCNTVNCNEMCHRLNYAGGMCRGNVCQCY